MGGGPRSLSLSHDGIYPCPGPEPQVRSLRLQLSYPAAASRRLPAVLRARPLLGHGPARQRGLELSGISESPEAGRGIPTVTKIFITELWSDSYASRYLLLEDAAKKDGTLLPDRGPWSVRRSR